MIFLRTSIGVELRGEDLVLTSLQSNFARGVLTHFKRIPDFRTRDKNEVRREIDSFFKNHHLSRDNIVLGLPKDEAILRNLELPAEVADNLRQVINFQVQSFEPTDEAKHYYDFTTLRTSASSKRLLVHLVMVKKATLDAHLNLMKELGLWPAIVTVSSAALVNLFSQTQGENGRKNYIIADLHPSGMELLALKEGVPLYVRDAGKEEGATWRDFILREIEQAAGKVRLGADESIEKIVLCGEESRAAEQELREAIPDTELLGSRIQFDMPLEIRSHLPELAVSLGLACSGIYRRTPVRINLLPGEMRVRQKGWAYIPTAVLLAAILVLATGLGVHRIFQERILSRQLDEEIQLLRPKAIRVQALRTEVEGIEKRIQNIEGLLRQRDMNLEVLKDLTSTLPADTFLSAYINRGGALTLNGSSNSAPELIPKLERSPVIQNVEMRGTVFRDSMTGKDRFNFEAKVEK